MLMVVVGGTNQIAYFLLSRIAQSADGALVVSRAERPNWARSLSSIEWCAGGLAKDAVARGDHQDWLHLAPLHLIPDVLPSSVRRLVVVSTTSVMTKRNSSSRAERQLVREIANQEQRLHQVAERAQVSLTILRPTLIYGCGLDANIARLARLARRLPIMALPKYARGWRQPVHADDVAQAVLASLRYALDSPSSRVLILPGAERVRYADMLERVWRAERGDAARVIVMPGQVFTALSYLAGPRRGRQLRAILDRLELDMCFDCGDWAKLGIVPRPFILDDLSLGRGSLEPC